MAYIQYLKFDDLNLPLPNSYDVDLSSVEADSSGETEAGTTQRDVVRTGVVAIAVTFTVSPKWLKILTRYSKMPKIAVQYFDTEDLDLKQTEHSQPIHMVKPNLLWRRCSIGLQKLMA